MKKMDPNNLSPVDVGRWAVEKRHLSASPVGCADGRRGRRAGSLYDSSPPYMQISQSWGVFFGANQMINMFQGPFI